MLSKEKEELCKGGKEEFCKGGKLLSSTERKEEECPGTCSPDNLNALKDGSVKLTFFKDASLGLGKVNFYSIG